MSIICRIMLGIESRGRRLGGDSLWRIERPTRMRNRKSGRMVFRPIGWNRPRTKESCLLRRSVCLRLITPSTSIYRTESFDDICRRRISAMGRWNRINSSSGTILPRSVGTSNYPPLNYRRLLSLKQGRSIAKHIVSLLAKNYKSALKVGVEVTIVMRRSAGYPVLYHPSEVADQMRSISATC